MTIYIKYREIHVEMSLKWPKPGQLDVPLYQVSSIPWVTQSFLANDEDVRKIEFPRVTRWVEIENDSSEENCLVNWLSLQMDSVQIILVP